MANNAYNPYLTGYQDYLPRSQERNRADDQPNTSQTLHPNLPLGVGSTRTASSAVVTAAPAAGSQGEAQQQQQPATGATMSVSVTTNVTGGGSNIDIVMPSQQPSDFHPSPEGRTTAVQPPNAGTLFPGMGAHQMSPAAVEIMIGGPEEYDVAMGSHLEGLTVPQMLDLDIDSLAIKIDKHHCQTKKAVLDHFMETKARLMQSANDAVDEERRKGLARLAAKEEELKLVLAELDAMRLKEQRLRELMSRACAAYGQAKERRRRTILQFQLFYSWREQAMILARRKRRVERAERWYTQVHLKRNVFRAWFRVAMRDHRVTVNNRYIQEVENAKRLIHEHYKGQLADLERLLADSHARLEQEAEARARLEDNMKRAFMRGVCALNIEAMTIMKRGAPPGGVNPFGISLPPSGEQRFQEQGPGGGPAGPTGAGAGSYGMPPPSGPPAGGGGGNYAMPAMTGQVLMESFNLDLRGSITVSPTRMAPGHGSSTAPPGGASGGGGGVAAASTSRPPSAATGTSITGTVRLGGGGGGMGTGAAAYGSGGGAGAGRAGGGGSGVAGNPLVVKGSGAMPPPGTISASAADGGPALRETAQAYYQRPQQPLVTRGPLGAGGASSEAPRPRTGAPLPTVRMI